MLLNFFPESHPELKPWANSDSAEAVLECPPLSSPGRGQQVAYTGKGKESGLKGEGGQTLIFLIFKQMLKKIQGALIRCDSPSLTVLV